MEITYRKMTRADFDDVLDMMRTFYTSPAVATDGSEEIYRADIEACLDPESPLTGYVFAEADTCVGYAMTYPGFATEYGRPCVWIVRSQLPLLNRIFVTSASSGSARDRS